MKKRIFISCLSAFTLVFLSSAVFLAWAATDVRLMTKDELQKIIDNPETYVLDVRTGRDWNSSEFKIQSAHRADPQSFSNWDSKFPKTGTLVLYCA